MLETCPISKCQLKSNNEIERKIPIDLTLVSLLLHLNRYLSCGYVCYSDIILLTLRRIFL